MISPRRYDLRITGYGDTEGAGQAVVVEFDYPSRVWRAVRGGAAAWVMAFATIFIPVAHFLLVPGFFIFGMVVFSRRLMTQALVMEVRGDCPDCGTRQEFDAGGRWQVPRLLNCGHCRRGLKADVRFPPCSPES